MILWIFMNIHTMVHPHGTDMGPIWVIGGNAQVCSMWVCMPPPRRVLKGKLCFRVRPSVRTNTSLPRYLENPWVDFNHTWPKYAPYDVDELIRFWTKSAHGQRSKVNDMCVKKLYSNTYGPHIWPMWDPYVLDWVGFVWARPICIPSGLSYQKPINTNTYGPHMCPMWDPYVLGWVGFVWARPSASHLGFCTKNPSKPTHMGPIFDPCGTHVC